MSHHSSGPDFGFPRGDARLDLTDLYAFPKPGDTTKSILIMNVHPSAIVNPSGPTTAEPFAPEAVYEFRIDTNGHAIADIAYRVRVSAVAGAEAVGMGDNGQIIVEAAPVSTGLDARVTDTGDHRFFAGRGAATFQMGIKEMTRPIESSGPSQRSDRAGRDRYPLRAPRRDRNACRISLAKMVGCSHAAKWPPLSTSFQ